MFGNSLSVDIGSSYIKLLYGSCLLGKLNINELGNIATPVEAYRNGYIENVYKIFEVIAEFIKNKKIKPRSVSFVIHSREIVSRNLELPIMDYINLEAMIKWEMNQYINGSMDEYCLSYEIVEKQKNTYKILTVIIPKKIVDSYIKLSEMLNLKLKYIDVSSKCLLRVFKRAGEGVVVIDLGHESIRISMFDKNKLYLDTELINAIYRCSINYDETSKESGLSLYDEVEGDICFKKFSQMIEFYNSNNFNRSIEKIYLIGGGSEYKENIEKAKEFFAKFEWGKDWTKQKYRIANEDYNKKINIYINCLGLLLRKG
jgi:type IV pilus assembly protein PilM